MVRDWVSQSGSVLGLRLDIRLGLGLGLAVGFAWGSFVIAPTCCLVLIFTLYRIFSWLIFDPYTYVIFYIMYGLW